MNDAGETTGSRVNGNSPSAADSVAGLIMDHGGTPLGALASGEPGVLGRLVPSSRSEGPGFNSST